MKINTTTYRKGIIAPLAFLAAGAPATAVIVSAAQSAKPDAVKLGPYRSGHQDDPKAVFQTASGRYVASLPTCPIATAQAAVGSSPAFDNAAEQARLNGIAFGGCAI